MFLATASDRIRSRSTCRISLLLLEGKKSRFSWRTKSLFRFISRFSFFFQPSKRSIPLSLLETCSCSFFFFTSIPHLGDETQTRCTNTIASIFPRFFLLFFAKLLDLLNFMNKFDRIKAPPFYIEKKKIIRRFVINLKYPLPKKKSKSNFNFYFIKFLY